MQSPLLFTLARGAILLWLMLWASLSSAQPAPPSDNPVPRPLTAPSQPRAPDTPLSTGIWAAHGALTLLPLGGVYAASRVRDERLWATGVQSGAGLLAAWVPARLLFARPQNAGPRWMELEVAAFGAGLVVTPPLAGLGTWAMGEWALHGSRHRGEALLGAMAGAAVGTLLGLAVHGGLERLVGPGGRLEPLRQFLALGLVGTGATVGYQWAGGGPRPR